MVVVALVSASVSYCQWREMHAGGVDTHNLAVATSNLADKAQAEVSALSSQASATERLLGATQAEAEAARAQSGAMDKLRAAGEAQALAMEHLESAGEAQAIATRDLARNSGNQLAAIRASADAAHSQAIAVQKQADASVVASRATDRLAKAGQAQASAVLQSLEVAKTANDIASKASRAADRPWLRISMPGDIEPVSGQEYKVDIDVSNVGRSPAVMTTANLDLSIVRADASVEMMLSPCSGTCQKFTVFPNANGLGSASSIGYHPRVPSEAMTKEAVEAIQERRLVVVLRVRVDYADSGGEQHTTTSCYFLAPKLGFTSCPVGNTAS